MKRDLLKLVSAGLVAVSFIAGMSFDSSAATLSAEKPLAGITLSFDKYCDNQLINSSKKTTASNTVTEKTNVKSKSSIKKVEDSKESEHLKLNLVYDRLGVANVKNYLNVRKKPSENSKIVGKMTRNSGCHVYKIKKGWAKIVSGKVKGYVKADFLLTDEKAEKRAKKVASLRVTVNTETLNVRSLPNIKSNIADQISEDEEYTVGKRNITKEWLQRYIKKHCK